MNLAALWQLPVFFLVENNLYGMGTSVERHSAQTDLSKKAEGYGIPGERIDGMDVIAVREGVAEGIRQAREERRPTILEAFTYRYRGHSAADPEVYREREEVEEWQQKDPIEAFAQRCVEAGVLGEREVQEVRDKAERAGEGGGRVRRRLARTGARQPLRKPLRGRRAGRAGTRSTSAAPSRTGASARRRRCPRRRASWPRPAPPTPASRTGRAPGEAESSRGRRRPGGGRARGGRRGRGAGDQRGAGGERAERAVLGGER